MKIVAGFLKGYVTAYKTRYITCILFAIISVTAGILPYYLIGQLLQNFIGGNRELMYYIPLLAGMVIFWIINAVAHAVSTTLSHKTAFQVIADVRKDLTSKLTRLPLGYVLNQPSGGLKSTFVEKANAIEPPMAHLVPEGTSAIVLPLGIAIYMFVLDWRMALLCFAIIPVSYIFLAVGFRGTGKRYKEYTDKNKMLNDVAVEYINGIKVIKVFRQTTSQYKRFRDTAKEAAECAVNWMKATAFPLSTFASILPAVLLTMLPGGLYFIYTGTLTVDRFLLLMILAMGIRAPLTKVGNFGELFSQMALNIESIVKIMNSPELERPEQLKAPITHYNIEFSNVDFSYQLENEADEKKILRGLNLEIKEDAKVAFVGPSGSGKSTIAKLIASFWDVKEGSVKIGGFDIQDIPLVKLNQMIAYVTQDTYLFNGTIRENIRMGNPAASDEEVESIARQAGCEEFILRLDHGFDTEVGGSGAHLSGGEKQRISLARAMLKNSPIVILDEATAYMDPENEAIIQRGISNLLKDKTVIVIAHRLSTIVQCDPIFLIKDGSLEAQGTHKELLQKSPLYQSMWQAHIESREEVLE